MPNLEAEPIWRLEKKLDFYGFLVFPYSSKGSLQNLLLRTKESPDLLDYNTTMYLCADLVSAVLEFNNEYQLIDCNLCLDHFVITDSFKIAFSNYSMMAKIEDEAPKGCYGKR